MEAYLLAIAITALVYVLLTLGLNFQYGFTGLINFGYVGFFALGAYATAICTARQGWPAWTGFAIGIVVPALLAWPIGRVALRLRDDYLAIVTLGFSEIVRLVIVSEKQFTNGNQGIAGVPKLFAGWTGPAGADVALAVVLVAACAGVVWLMRAIVRSPYGRLIQAIRDDETALLALGKNPARFKTQVLMLGAAIAGLAGSFYAHYIGFVTPEQFVPIVTFQVWMAMIMGGVGRLRGAVVGAFLLLAVLEGSRVARDVLPGISEVAMSSARLGVIGLALILFIRFRPQGLLGIKRD
ncbi:branched-chain amino acid ABC transporter permease [Xylophilus sp. Leaf220]|uniref:branched-chain amino acid ABC transporter permease n=1 Tax=Xylophilus sp. Leaf220 TaxID=1735686 RepID=UPI0006F47171|nr:branched-chain amino acid ABC transporter permease [Xylophilus sp. Leaf220]KQM69740.1 ABC transporter permease [Xylophilus sp. Leaf220]